jgi:hypothetical protein
LLLQELQEAQGQKKDMQEVLHMGIFVHQQEPILVMEVQVGEGVPFSMLVVLEWW